MASRQEELAHAVERALAQDWAAAHDIAQRHEGDAVADWLHAALHKIEGDDGNARYWYRRAQRRFDEFADAQAELAAIRDFLSR
ncbi:MAG: hypothetical protein ABI457_04720 [Hyphomicrobium sp.]|jgi:hypothetical protein